ncbi:MAG: GGDEF domain-containing protein [Candidatus Melainabacteria bacterium]
MSDATTVYLVSDGFSADELDIIRSVMPAGTDCVCLDATGELTGLESPQGLVLSRTGRDDVLDGATSFLRIRVAGPADQPTQATPGEEAIWIVPPQSPVFGQWLTHALHQGGQWLNLKQALQDSSEHDSLSALYNETFFLKRMNEEISLSRRHLTPVVCMIVGIRFFTMLQDTYGQSFVQSLYRQMADKIQQLIRQEDIAARVADNEVGILLPRSTEKGARILAQRLADSLNGLTIRHEDHEDCLSITIGIAEYPVPDSPGADADTIIRYARHALHQARCRQDEDEDTPVIQLFSEIQLSL